MFFSTDITQGGAEMRLSCHGIFNAADFTNHFSIESACEIILKVAQHL